MSLGPWAGGWPAVCSNADVTQEEACTTELVQSLLLLVQKGRPGAGRGQNLQTEERQGQDQKCQQ